MALDLETERLFAEIAVEKELVTQEVADECYFNCEQTRGGTEQRVGEIMIIKGILTKVQALGVLKEAHMRRGDKPRIGGYELAEKLGSGGMGVVYKARQISMDRNVALKILPRRLSKDKTFVQRFLKEAQVMARLNHRNIIGAIDVGEAGGFYYFAMELIDGVSCDELLKEKERLPESDVLMLAVQAVQGLLHAQEQGITHRDIKPSNLMVCPDGTLKIADLGLALVHDLGESNHTGIRAGTPYYMAPEQVEGSSQIDFRADIYALGATLYELVTGKRPFEGDSPRTIMAKRLNEDPVPPIDICPQVSKGLSAIIMKMMARNQEDRFESFDDLLSDLHLVASGKLPACARGKTALSSGALTVVGASRRTTRTSVAVEAVAGRKTTRSAMPASRGTGLSISSRVARKKGIGQYLPVLIIMCLIILGGTCIFVLTQAKKLRGPKHPYPEQQNASLWLPFQEPVHPKEGGRALWIQARNSYLKSEKTKDASDRNQSLVLYKQLVSQYPDCAYVSRAKERISKLSGQGGSQ